MSGRWKILGLAAVVGLGGCASIPTSPSVMVLPGAGKSFEQFQADNAVCRDWASQQVGTTSTTAAAQSTAGTAAVGTVLGAGLGAAIGAGTGLLGGTALGASAGQASGTEVQRRYDIAYQQCMYAKGNQIPGVVRAARPGSLVPVPPPPPPGAAPAPPASPPLPGIAPPPPPR